MDYRKLTKEHLKQAKEELEREAKECAIDIAKGVSDEDLRDKYGYDCKDTVHYFGEPDYLIDVCDTSKQKKYMARALDKIRKYKIKERALRIKQREPLEIKFQLPIPSGKMVVGNDFRSLFPVNYDGWDINMKHGKKDMCLGYLKSGLAMGFIGNTCASFRKQNLSHFYIGPAPKGVKTKIIGGICTDLWWYSICDYDEFVKRVPDFDESKESNLFVVKCKPGVYEFNNFYHDLSEEETYNKPYAAITWVSDCDKKNLKDFKKEYDEFNLTAEQVFHGLFRLKHDFYGNPKKSYIKDSYAHGVHKSLSEKLKDIPKKEIPFYHVADSLMCLNGSGYEVHKNGFVMAGEIPADEPEIEIPLFDKKYRWYPWSIGYSKLGLALDSPKTKLNPSFVRLAFNILQCIIRHGHRSSYEDCGDKVDIKKIEKAMDEEAKICFASMVLKYGCPDFCKDLEYLVDEYKNVEYKEFEWKVVKKD